MHSESTPPGHTPPEHSPYGSHAEADQRRLGGGTDRRLHPLSVLFSMFEQIKGFALPLILLMLFGRRSDEEGLWGLGQWTLWLLGGLLLLEIVLSLARYFSYRFRIDAGELVVRSGLFQRNVRHVPLARIQSVTLHRKLLHRLAGVAEVRLESAAGGTTPEAQMRVLSMDDAQALERVVERHRSSALSAPAPVPASASASTEQAAASPTAGTADTAAPAQVLLQLPVQELVKLGLSSNRGLILMAAGLGFLLDFFSDLLGDSLIQTVNTEAGSGMQRLLGEGLHMAGWLLAGLLLGLILLTLIVIAAQLLSVLMALLRNYGFTLEQLGPRLSVERGLLTRVRASAPLRRIQRWNVHDNPILRLFKRQSLSVETAATRQGNEEQTISDLIPIASPQQIQQLLRHWLPGWPADIPFQPIHPKAWRRFFTALLIKLVLLMMLAAPIYGFSSLLLLMALPLCLYIARRRAAACGYVLTDSFLIWRSGWLLRRISIAPIGKLQGLVLLQNPFDRRLRMASLRADTAGAPVFGRRMHLLHLPETEARALYRVLATRLARTPWRW